MSDSRMGQASLPQPIKKTQDGANAVPLVIASGPQARGSSPDQRVKRREILWPYSGTVK